MPVLDENKTPEDYEARRPMLLAAVADTEGTIQGTDTKASIALVIHGLLLSALASVVPEVDVDGAYEVFTVMLLAGVVIAFTSSVAQLLRCIMPTPARVFSGIEGGHNVFFIQAKADPVSGQVSGLPKVADVHTALVSMDRAELEEDLIVELVALSAVRARKIALVGNGLKWLALEIGLAVLLAVTLGVEAL